MIIDCIGCLHGAYPKLEGGDLLIVTGDLTAQDKDEEYIQFEEWFEAQKYRRKIVIGGNHDNFLEKYGHHLFLATKDGHDQYLCDSGVEFEGLKIWGAPWSAACKNINPKCMAFTLPFGCDTEEHLMDHWELIPHDTNILITHTPAYGILDGIPLKYDGTLFHAGSNSLFGWLKYVERPLLHAFSHIHEGYGVAEIFPSYNDRMMISVNCSIMNEHYEPVNDPIRVIL